jgi:hypothetical protein
MKYEWPRAESEICTFKPASRPNADAQAKLSAESTHISPLAPRRVIFRWIISKCSIMTANNRSARQPASKHEQSAVCLNSGQFNATPGAYTDKKTCCVLERRLSLRQSGLFCVQEKSASNSCCGRFRRLHFLYNVFDLSS